MIISCCLAPYQITVPKKKITNKQFREKEQMKVLSKKSVFI